MGDLFLLGRKIKSQGERAQEIMNLVGDHNLSKPVRDDICSISGDLEFCSSKLYELCTFLDLKPQGFAKFHSQLQQVPDRKNVSDSKAALDEMLGGG